MKIVEILREAAKEYQGHPADLFSDAADEIEKRMADEAMNAARIDELKEALADVFTGWDALAGERFHSPGAVEKWLNKDIGPAILRARAVAFASDGGEHE